MLHLRYFRFAEIDPLLDPGGLLLGPLLARCGFAPPGLLLDPSLSSDSNWLKWVT